MEKHVVLKDGNRIRIRDMEAGDLSALLEFFRSLPEGDRRYLRYDVTDARLLRRRMEDVPAERVLRLVAVDGDAIVADGALELTGHGWGEGVAEIRLIVARSHQRKGLGRLVARELYLLAAERKVERIVVRMMAPQVGARRIFAALGFQDEYVIPSHVRDRKGEWQDLVIMRCSVDELWERMEEAVVESDWLSHR